MEKRGQVTAFVILGVAIVAVIVLAFFIYPSVSDFISGAEINPRDYLQKCVSQDLRTKVDKLALGAGYNDPEGFILYAGQKVKYLCYDSQYYKLCYIQQPKIKENFENELNKVIAPNIEKCVNQFKDSYQRKGYLIEVGKIESGVSILPNQIVVNVNAPMSITKDSTQTFKEFQVEMDSQMYDLIMVAHSMVEYEATYGDADTVKFIDYNPNLMVNKDLLSDGTAIYDLSNVVTKERFMFASRSVAMPAGYGLTEVIT